MSVKVTLTFQVEAYIDVFDILDYLDPHVPGDISWSVVGVHDNGTGTKRGRRSSAQSPQPETQASIDDAIAEAERVATRGYIDPAVAEADALVGELPRLGGRNQVRRVVTTSSGTPEVSKLPVHPPASRELREQQAERQRARLTEHSVEARGMSAEQRRADAAAVEAAASRPDLAHLTRAERRAVVRSERKSKRAAIKRAMEAEKMHALLEWLGDGDQLAGEQIVAGVACTYCQADPDQLCHTAGGYEYTNTFHADRFIAAAGVLGLDYAAFERQLYVSQERYRHALEILSVRSVS